MQMTVKRGNRLFAIPKPMTLTDRFAAKSASGIRKNLWKLVDDQSGGGRRARVCVNQR